MILFMIAEKDMNVSPHLPVFVDRLGATRNDIGDSNYRNCGDYEE